MKARVAHAFGGEFFDIRRGVRRFAKRVEIGISPVIKEDQDDVGLISGPRACAGEKRQEKKGKSIHEAKVVIGGSFSVFGSVRFLLPLFQQSRHRSDGFAVFRLAGNVNVFVRIFFQII